MKFRKRVVSGFYAARGRRGRSPVSNGTPPAGPEDRDGASVINGGERSDCGDRELIDVCLLYTSPSPRDRSLA
eukprot:410707-Pyramimonas_sp.AAC.1